MWAIGEKKAQDGTGENFTFLAKGVEFKGVVNFQGTVRVDGRVDGEIHTTGTVIVGEHAVIKGLVSAGTVIASGRINGTVTATEKVQMLKPGILIADIHTPAVSIEDGAHFHGMCDMGAQKGMEDQATAHHDLPELACPQGKVRSADL